MLDLAKGVVMQGLPAVDPLLGVELKVKPCTVTDVLR